MGGRGWLPRSLDTCASDDQQTADARLPLGFQRETRRTDAMAVHT